MSTITAIRKGKRNEKRLNLYLDGKFVFSLKEDEAAREKLTVGLELTGERLQTLMESLKQVRCLNAAYRYLGYRPRSEAELRDRLQRRGFPHPHIETTLERLREQGLAHDGDFAKFWVENRSAFSPRSKSLARSELRKKGVKEEVIREAIGELDETEAAYNAAQGKARRLAALEFPEFRQRLGDFLRRRGFGYDIINRTVKKVWEERNNSDKQ